MRIVLPVFLVLVVLASMAVFVARRRAAERGLAIAGLPMRQRRSVWRAVARGREVGDPALRPTTVELARSRAADDSPQYPWLNRLVGALFVVAVLLNLWAGSWWIAALNACLGIYFAVGLPILTSRYARNRVRAITANGGALESPRA